MYNKFYTPLQAKQKIKPFCSYQERSHSEVIAKLYSFGLAKKDIEQILSELIEEDYLNEERFAVQFAGGKFRIKNWGKVKIKHELSLRKVSTYNIKKALESIDNNEYEKIFKKLLTEKWSKLKNEQYINRMAKTTNYLLQKGFEPSLIKNEIQKIRLKIINKN